TPGQAARRFCCTGAHEAGSRELHSLLSRPRRRRRIADCRSPPRGRPPFTFAQRAGRASRPGAGRLRRARIADRLETASRATAVTLLDLGPRRIRIPATLDLRPRRLSRILSKRKLSCGSSASHEVKTTLDFPSARKECRSPL